MTPEACAPGSSGKVAREPPRSKVGSPAGFATAAGWTGLAANVLLVAFYALQVRQATEPRFSLGSLNDLVGSLSTAFMIPVGLALGAGISRWVGITAMTVLSLDGPLLVVRIFPEEVLTSISVAAVLVLSGWLLVVNRQESPRLPAAVSRLGRWCGTAILTGAVVVGSGFALPNGSWLQYVVLGAGGLPALIAWLAIPVWFLRLGRTRSWACHGAAAESGDPGSPEGSPSRRQHRQPSRRG